ncbi:MAG TPA: hypothetical protein ENK37_07070 [Oceanithermus profundus]|uniref:Uncharacterized protein n=1 Tax=Oceanithermus profundus TaxID=187137 RepID=A0A7C4Z5J9_9DEIN|nr:hypothetical protein [Oceanithermus profundus]
MKQVGEVLERAVRYAFTFVAHMALGLLLAGLLVAAARALSALTVWSWMSSEGALTLLTSPLNWAGALIGWVAAAWMAYLVVGWLQQTLEGRRPAFAAAVGAALGAGLPILAANLLLGLVFLRLPYRSAAGAYPALEAASLAVLALLLPAMVFAAARAEGFRSALIRLAEVLASPGYGRFLRRPGFWVAFALLAAWLLLSKQLGGPHLPRQLGRPELVQFYGFAGAEALRGFLTTVVGLPIVAAVLRSVYDEAWGSPGEASATPAPPAA